MAIPLVHRHQIWCGTGWTMTDWIEDLMLRVAGVEAYPTNGSLNSGRLTEMNEVLDYIRAIWFNDAYVYGGRAAIPTISFGDAPKNPCSKIRPSQQFDRVTL